MVAGRFNGEHPTIALAAEHSAGREPALGLVGADVDGHLAADAVGPPDHADHDLDGITHRGLGAGRQSPGRA